MDGSSKETEENVMLFHDNTDENRPEENEQNVSETNLASKQHGSISEIDKVTDKIVPSNTVDSETPENIETGTELGPVRRSTRQKTQFILTKNRLKTKKYTANNVPLAVIKVVLQHSSTIKYLYYKRAWTGRNR
jgi:hypothetical protein